MKNAGTHRACLLTKEKSERFTIWVSDAVTKRASSREKDYLQGQTSTEMNINVMFNKKRGQAVNA